MWKTKKIATKKLSEELLHEGDQVLHEIFYQFIKSQVESLEEKGAIISGREKLSREYVKEKLSQPLIDKEKLKNSSLKSL